mgnify:FL=1
MGRATSDGQMESCREVQEPLRKYNTEPSIRIGCECGFILMAKAFLHVSKPCAVRRNRDQLPPALNGLMLASEPTRGPDIQLEAPANMGGLI